MDLSTAKKALVTHYAQEAAKDARTAAATAKAAEIIGIIKVAIEIGKGKPMPKDIFGHVFGATMDVLEKRGIQVANRKDFNNNESGFELIAALLDVNNPEHAIAVEAVTGEAKDVTVAEYKRPELKKNTSINYGLPAGAVDLTETVKGN